MPENILTNFQYSRQQQRYSTLSGTTPTIPVLTGETMTGYTEADNMVLGNFTDTDLLNGEFFINTADDRVFLRSDDRILEFITTGGTMDNVSTTGGTWNPYTNILTYTKSDGVSYSVFIDSFSGLTVNGTLSATTIDGNTILSGGTNINTLFSPILTAANGINITTGNTIELGGILNKTTSISGGTQSLNLGLSTSLLLNHNVYSIQGFQSYTSGSVGVTVTDNPGGRLTKYENPTTRTSYEINPGLFEVKYSGASGVSTLQLNGNYSLTTNTHTTTSTVNSTTATDYTVNSNNFYISPTSGLTTIDSGSDISTSKIIPTFIEDKVTNGTSYSTTKLTAIDLLNKVNNGTGNEIASTISTAQWGVSRTADSGVTNNTITLANDFSVDVNTDGILTLATTGGTLEIDANSSILKRNTNNSRLDLNDSFTSLIGISGNTIITDTGANTVFNGYDGARSLTFTSTGTRLIGSSATQLFINTSGDTTFIDGSSVKSGIEYAADYSANYTNLSLITKGDLDAATSGSSLTASNGINITGGTIQLGGILNQNTVLSGASKDFEIGTSSSQVSIFKINAVQSIEDYTSGGSGLSVNKNPANSIQEYDFELASGTKSAIAQNVGNITTTVSSGTGATRSQLIMTPGVVNILTRLNGSSESGFILDEGLASFKFIDSRVTTKGLEYEADYSTGYTSLSLITKGDLDYAITGSSVNNIYNNNGTVGSGRTVTLTDTLSFSGGGINITGAGTTSGSNTLIIKNEVNLDLLRVLSNGYVGVGTSAPTTYLEVNKDMGTYSPTALPDSQAKIRNPTQQGNGLAGLTFQAAPQDGFFEGVGYIGLVAGNSASYGDMYFGTRSAGGFTEKVRIVSTGEVGIGLTAPTARLQVKGAGSTSATNSLHVQNSSSTTLLKTEDDGGVFIGVAPASSTTAAILARNTSTGEIETRTLASIKPTLSKTFTLEAPTATEDFTIFRTDVAITIVEVIAVSVGTTPSTTYQLKHDTDRDAAGTAVTTSAATTSKTTGDIATASDYTIPANSWIWLETTAASGTSVKLTIDIRYTED